MILTVQTFGTYNYMIILENANILGLSPLVFQGEYIAVFSWERVCMSSFLYLEYLASFS